MTVYAKCWIWYTVAYINLIAAFIWISGVPIERSPGCFLLTLVAVVVWILLGSFLPAMIRQEWYKAFPPKGD